MAVYLLAVVKVAEPYDGGCGAYGPCVVEDLLACGDAAYAVVVYDAYYVGVLKACCGLEVFAVVHQEDVFAGGVFQDGRGICAGELEYVFGFVVGGAVGCGLGVKAELLQEPGVGYGAADGVGVRALVAYYVDGAVY